MQFVQIEWQSDLYQHEIELRDEILRRPLGLVFSDADLAAEAKQDHFGLVDDEQLVACLVIVPLSPSLAKLRQMAVAQQRQRQGLGAMLIGHVEQTLTRRGVRRIELHARDVAIGFYQRLGYQREGDEFIEVSIPHFKLVKDL